MAALQGGGHRVITANDGEEPQVKPAADRPDLIVLDVDLLKKNGFQVCRPLKTTANTQGTSTVLLSRKSQASDKFWGSSKGPTAT